VKDFEHLRPKTVAEARDALDAQSDGSFLAGGQTLIPVLKQGLAMPSGLIDLSAIKDLQGITVADGSVSIGAMTTHAQVAASNDVQKAIPALAGLAGGIGDPQVRNRGTIGGSLANNDPSADYPAVVLALSAAVVTDKRNIPADEYFTGMFETALDEGEMITGVEFPVPGRAAYAKCPNPASRYAMAGVFVAQAGGAAKGTVRVAVTGAGPGVFRATEMETALDKDFQAGALEGITLPEADLLSDIHASAAYRAHLIAVMAGRAVDAANGVGGAP
jgi:carbon-monoxide dehydrogenase medium subunit